MAGEAGRLKRIVLVVAALGCCAATGTSSPVQTLAGRYDQSLLVPQYRADGSLRSKDRVDDVIEIVPVSPDAAYFRIDFPESRKKSCDFAGVATFDGENLVYHDLTNPINGTTPCVLMLSHTDNRMSVADPTGSCMRAYCGPTAWLGRPILFSSKRPITYMGKLKASPEYRDALTEWRTGKPVNR